MRLFRPSAVKQILSSRQILTMSKRGSLTPAAKKNNTLFNYFSKSPHNGSPSTTLKRKPSENGEKQIHTLADSDTDDEIVPVLKNRKRIRLASGSDSDEENTGNVKDNNSINKSILEASFKFESKNSTTPIKINGKSEKKLKEQKSAPNGDESINESVLSSSVDGDNWVHCHLDWLRLENIQDSEKRRPEHPDYDKKTLYVPRDFLEKQTPAHRQWWEIKSNHYDCVLFFKVGKFYELYHMDAAVGVNELGFSYMKGDFAHSGFPESAYPRMVSSLIQKGYKVARVEQTETPEMMQERIRKLNLPSKVKVVRREICQISCKGIEVCGLQELGPTDALPSYMLAICEQNADTNCRKYGVCFIDISIGLFHLGQFEDDRHSSRLLTTLAHFPPSLILLERGSVSDITSNVLKSCQSYRKELLIPQKQFWSPTQTLKTLAEKYFQSGNGVKWPTDFKVWLSEGDALGLTPIDKGALAIRALGACIWYLSDSLLDIQVMEMSRFTVYSPPDVFMSVTQKDILDLPNNMVLDASTLNNLRIVGNDLSLYSKLDHCVTPMGKRLLYQWVCAPSCVINTIKERQDAISYLLKNQSLVQDIRPILNTLPDIERIVVKICSLGSLNKSRNHPDCRAILYDEKIYSKRKVLDFIALLNAFQTSLNIMNKLEGTDSSLLKRITQMQPNGCYPDYEEVLKYFKGAFDHKLAEKDGIILPEKGIDSEYDNIIQSISEIEEELKDYLKSQEKHFGCKVTYFGTDRKRYQLEVPESKSGKAGHGYHCEGAKKGYKRFSTADTKDFLNQMMAAEEQKRVVLKDLSRRIFEKFGQSHDLWQQAVNSIATIDVLLALCEYVRLQSGEMCIPEVYCREQGQQPYIMIKDGRHPCMPCSVDFIPNDTSLNTNGETSLILLTGPNMGGKSTLMRQLGILTIMAQIGCYVPAAECSLNIVDRIFTRLGAHDDIMAGQSTFFVELSETAAILKHTTINSLVLLDELGRGTSTYDGTAIAAAVVKELSNRGCRTVFSTHYHTLVEDFKTNPNISLAHMSCMVETEESDSNDDDAVVQETVTFLYKLSKGACPKSYGFNAARLAGITKQLTRKAHRIAMQMEKEANLVKCFKKMFFAKSNIREVLKQNTVDSERHLN